MFTQRSKILSNFHANAKYVKYAHNLGITVIKLHKKGRNRLKMPEEVQPLSNNTFFSVQFLNSFVQKTPKCNGDRADDT